MFSSKGRKKRFFPLFFDDLGHFEPIKQRTFWENCGKKNASRRWAENFIKKKKAPSKLLTKLEQNRNWVLKRQS